MTANRRVVTRAPGNSFPKLSGWVEDRPMAKVSLIQDAAKVSRQHTSSSVRWFGSVSRQGVLAAERATQHPTGRTGFRYTLSLLAGALLIGIGASFYIHSNLGVPAYDVLYTAISQRTGLSIGQSSWVFAAAIVTFCTAVGHRPTLNGLIFIVAIGLSIDGAVAVIRDADSLPMQALFVLLGTAAIAAGIALILHAGLTGGPMELLMKVADDYGVDPFKMRVTVEFLIVAVGVVLGGDAGPGTLFFVVTLSPLIRLVQQALQDHRSGRSLRLQQIDPAPFVDDAIPQSAA